MTAPLITRAARHHLAPHAAAVVLLHVLGAAVLLAATVTAGGAGLAAGLGLGAAAYGLGVRHAFDADHIAAIDNATRSLLQRRRSPHGVGFFFSAGHSTVVVVLAVLVAIGVQQAGTAVTDESSAFRQFAGVWGPAVAGTFLLVVGIANLGALRRAARELRRGGTAQPAAGLAAMGPVGRLTRRLASRVGRPAHMYPAGLLFGVGFDTASEIGLLVLAGGSAAAGLPIATVIALGLLFAAGMTLLDTANGAAAARAYSWSQAAPAHRAAYDAAVTGISVLCALLVGTVSLSAALTSGLGLTGGPVSQIASLDTGALGYGLAGVLVTVWGSALLWVRVRGRAHAAP